MKGVKEKGFVQPCSMVVDNDNTIYVVDTGNSRQEHQLYCRIGSVIEEFFNFCLRKDYI